MGLLRDLGSAAYEKLKERAEETQEYYSEGMSMSEEDLLDELRRWRRNPAGTRYQGYKKAAERRGLL